MDDSELRWFGRTLPKTLKQLRVFPFSDLHYGNPYCSLKHAQRTLKAVAENPDTYLLANGDLIEAALKTSVGDVYSQKVTPQEQRDAVIALLMPVKDKILGMTCLTDDTLVLTDSGWKSCYELVVTDKVYSVNVETNESEYAELSAIHIKAWDDDILELTSERQHQCLTPDHWVLYWNDFKDVFEYRQAHTLPTDMHHLGIPIARPYRQGVTFLSDDEIRFCAWVITEGHIDTKKVKAPIIEITQSLSSKHFSGMEALFSRLGMSPSKHLHPGRQGRTNESDWCSFYFPNNQVAKYITVLDGKKEIPRSILDLAHPQLQLFYETLMCGDGCHRVYFTANEKLALQVLELILKLGYGARLCKRVRTQLYNGYDEPVNTTSYEVRRYRYSNAFARAKRSSHFTGNVFCLKTSSGNFMAMRNGCPFFTGNTGNHEARIYKETGIDISQDIAKALGVPYRAEGILLKISFGDNNNRTSGKPYTYWVYATHGYGGARTKSAKAVKVERLGTWIHADCYIMSHDHVVNAAPDIYLLPDPRGMLDSSGFMTGKLKAMRKMLVKSNSFVKWGGYSEQGGFPPSDLSVPMILFAGQGEPRVQVMV